MTLLTTEQQMFQREEDLCQVDARSAGLFQLSLEQPSLPPAEADTNALMKAKSGYARRETGRGQGGYILSVWLEGCGAARYLRLIALTTPYRHAA